MKNQTTVIEIKPYTPAELARLYGVSKRTLRTWLNPHMDFIGERQGLYYTALQVKHIFERLGLPCQIIED